MERPDSQHRPVSLQQLGSVVTGRRYLLLTTAATAIAVASAAQRLDELPASASISSTAMLFLAELMSSRISAVIMLHFFLVAMYHVLLLLARAALGSLRPVELQQTKETLIPFVLLRCQLLVSTMEPAAHGQRSELGLLVVWLAALAVLRALLSLTQARFQHVMTRPMTQLRDLQRLGGVLGGVVVLNIALAASCSRLALFSERIVHVPWFEASLLLLKTLELGVQVGFQALDVSAANFMDEDENASPGYSENSEFHLLLLQTVLSGCYLVQLVLYYLYVISVDQFRVSLFDLILILNVKNATVRLLEKIKHVKLYHQVVLDLDHLFPDASPEELESVSDDVSAFLSRWVPFPNFSFEIVRHRGRERTFEVTQEMLQQIWEVFPQYTLEELHADLTRTRSVERTMERILNGRLDGQRLAMEQRNTDRVDMTATGVLGDAVIDLGENFRWSLSTLVSALWNPLPPAIETPRQVAESNEGVTAGEEEAQRQEHQDVGTESLLRRLERWRDQRRA
ncbi:hypothetical protein BBO99_00008436 [Phytophthora kernoviae]|uniref:CUE domain-containing protein n=1 Tax=Phytophthora kernoviae TaxID=325452 RepID=A0A3R7HSB5_9STRA|nr:hypothetical protein BBI17_008378 [Phytophthora kernoviae]RLN75282.1 hypothetical protein BBO99_00008436 [Phytophthora kernoviae]